MDRIRVNELSSRIVDFDVLDSDGVVIPAANITVAQLTLYDCDTFVPGASPAEGIINSRDAQSVLNANNVVIADSGSPANKLVTWTMQPEDNPIVTPRRQIERHRAEFHFAFTTGEYNTTFEIEVMNLGKAS